jgi:hypothetical protein
MLKASNYINKLKVKTPFNAVKKSHESKSENFNKVFRGYK